MKERPILMSAPMVRAILDGAKRQTRRVVKHQGVIDASNEVGSWDGPGDEDKWLLSFCPYGALGDRLWVRETFSTSALSVYPCPPAWYRADFGKHEDPRQEPHVRECDNGARPVSECWRCTAEREGSFRWTPSIYMPRWASRITLAVESVRVERLHDITEKDARAEGLPWSDGEPLRGMPTRMVVEARTEFRHLWMQINGADSWDANPFVWVVGFSRVTP